MSKGLVEPNQSTIADSSRWFQKETVKAFQGGFYKKVLMESLDLHYLNVDILPSKIRLELRS